MEERRFKLGAHHFALLAFVVAAGLLAYNLFRPEPPGGFGAGHKVRTFGLVTDAEGVLANRSEMEGALELARAVVLDEKVDEAAFGALTAFEGRRVFLTVYGVTFPGAVSTGKGDTLFDSVVAAAENLRESSKVKWDKQDPASMRVRIDVVTRASKKRLREDVYLPPRESIGTWGMLLENDDGALTYLTEGEFVELGLFHTKKKGLVTEKLTDLLEGRAGLGAHIPHDAAFSRFYSRSYIEGPGGEGVLELYRNHATPNDEANLDTLAPTARAAADYIARIIDERGKHNYKYYPVEDRDSGSYNMLRHAGTTYALMQAHERFRDPAYKAAAERSFEYLLGRTELREDEGPWGADYRFIIEDRKAKLGGSGLALVAMCQYTEATGDRRYLEEMRQFARFIVRQQDPQSGKLISYYDYGPTAIVPDEDSIYYPGEALYALGKFYYLDPNPLWLETANKGAYWLIFDRDADKEPLKLPHDHWLMMALSYLYAHTDDEAYDTHCMNIASAIAHKHRGADHDMVEDYPDYLGSFYKTARVTPIGCRIEGLVGGVDLCKLAGKDYRSLLNMATLSAGLPMTLQFDPANSFYLPNERKALGGLPEGIYESPIRNDFVQHTLSGFIGVERHIAADQGILLPGGPQWVRDHIVRGEVFQGWLPPGKTEAEVYPGEPLYHVPYMGEQVDTAPFVAAARAALAAAADEAEASGAEAGDEAAAAASAP